MNKILEHVLQKDGNIKYLLLNNRAGKTWVLQNENIKTALGLYQPASMKGKLIKRFMSLFAKSDWLISALRIQVSYYDIKKQFVQLMEEIFQEQNLEYTFFLGTPGVHRKITIQIAKGEKIFGYCKMTDSKEISQMFEREKGILTWLYEKGVCHIPRCLYCGPYINDIQMFVQTTEKTVDSKTLNELQQEHIHFLQDIYHKTKTSCSYEESDFYKTVKSFEKEILYYSKEEDIKRDQGIIKYVNEQASKNHEFSFYHGDFTMWNTLMVKDTLYAFDFEYATRTYPPMLDIFHLFTQQELYINTRNATEIFVKFESVFVDGNFANLFENPYLQYIFYLVHIIEFYLKRDKNKFSKEIIGNLKTWYLLLEMNIKKCISDTEKGKRLW